MHWLLFWWCVHVIIKYLHVLDGIEPKYARINHTCVHTIETTSCALILILNIFRLGLVHIFTYLNFFKNSFQIMCHRPIWKRFVLHEQARDKYLTMINDQIMNNFMHPMQE